MTPEWPLPRLSRVLHPLDAPLVQAPWNYEELADLLGDAPAVDAAVLVGLVPRQDGPRVLLTRRTDSLRNHAGQVSFPGGRIELDDADAIAAAMREAHEEIGLAPSLIAPIGLLDPMITITGFRVLPVVACIEPNYVPEPDPGEVAEVFEVGLDFLMHPDNLMRVELQHRGRTRHVLEFRSAPEAPQHRIWGVTASILFNLRERLAREPA
ncbi:MAG: CoA pyrophosphatase [Xanthomonadaceae bacterium]|nr:CoA pyrophosphatase [Xanthomonadaceae bacterium]